MLVVANNQLRNAFQSQQLVVKSMNALTTKGFFASLFTFVSNDTYYVVSFNVLEHFDICRQLAVKFSKHPEVFLGKHRKEIQFDDVALTLSVDSWVKCTRLYEFQMDTPIEYYLHTEKFVPHTIFFRIKKKHSQYREKLEFFIESLIDRKRLESASAEHQQTMLEHENQREVGIDVYDIPDVQDITDMYDSYGGPNVYNLPDIEIGDEDVIENYFTVVDYGYGDHAIVPYIPPYAPPYIPPETKKTVFGAAVVVGAIGTIAYIGNNVGYCLGCAQ